MFTSSMVISSASSRAASFDDCANANETAIFSIGSELCSTMTLFKILARVAGRSVPPPPPVMGTRSTERGIVVVAVVIATVVLVR